MTCFKYDGWEVVFYQRMYVWYQYAQTGGLVIMVILYANSISTKAHKTQHTFRRISSVHSSQVQNNHVIFPSKIFQDKQLSEKRIRWHSVMFESRYLWSCWKKKLEAVQMHTSNSFSSATLVITVTLTCLPVDRKCTILFSFFEINSETFLCHWGRTSKGM